MDNCKVCGTTMQNFEEFGSEYTGEAHYESVRAYCPKCKKYYRWIEVFTFSHCEEFEEDI